MSAAGPAFTRRVRADRWPEAFGLFVDGRFAEAEVLLRQAVRGTPENDLLRAPYLQVLGRIRAATGRTAGATAAFDASFRLLARDAVQSCDAEIAGRRTADGRLQGAKDLSVSFAQHHPTQGAVTTALRHVRACKAIVPALRRADAAVARSIGGDPVDLRLRLPPDGLRLDITRYRPCELRTLTGSGSAPPARYAAFAVSGRGAAATVVLFDIGPADAVDDLIAGAREELSGEPGVEGGALTFRVADLRRLEPSPAGGTIEHTDRVFVTYVRSGQRIERRLRVDAETLRGLLERIDRGEPLSLREIRRLSADRPAGPGSPDRGSHVAPPVPVRPPAVPVGTRDLATGTADAAGDPAITEDAWAVGQRLLRPLARRWPRARHLVVAPDGDFWLFPFAALSQGGSAPVLVDAAITVVDDGLDASSPPSGALRSAPPLVIADPALSAESSSPPVGYLAPLRGAYEEGVAVARMLGTTCRSGRKATDRSVRAATSPVVLHLATHGFAVPDRRPGGLQKVGTGGLRGLDLLANQSDPDYRAGLALAGAADWMAHGTALPEPGEGVLLAADVAALDFSGTRLVVLSACETGLGQVAPDDTPWSLARAFRRAGARAVVMSLWRVPDRSTRLLFEAFYARLLDGHPPAQALRAAQLTRRSAGAPPQEWAAFVCWQEPGSDGPAPAATTRC